MQTTLRIDDEVYRQAKAEAARLGLTMTRFIEEALQARIQRSVAVTPNRQAETDARDQLMESLLHATAHFRVGPKPTRKEMHER